MQSSIDSYNRDQQKLTEQHIALGYQTANNPTALIIAFNNSLQSVNTPRMRAAILLLATKHGAYGAHLLEQTLRSTDLLDIKSIPYPAESTYELHERLAYQIAYGEGSEIFKRHTFLLWYWATENAVKDPVTYEWNPLPESYMSFTKRTLSEGACRAIAKLLTTPGALFSQTIHTLKILQTNKIISMQRARYELWAARTDPKLIDLCDHKLILIGTIATILNVEDTSSLTADQLANHALQVINHRFN